MNQPAFNHGENTDSEDNASSDSGVDVRITTPSVYERPTPSVHEGSIPSSPVNKALTPFSPDNEGP